MTNADRASGVAARTPSPLAIVMAIAFCLHARPGGAQDGGGASPGRVELSVGAVWTGASEIGSSDATLTAPGGSRFTLFSTSSTLGGATGIELRVARRLTTVFEVEAAATSASPLLTTTITRDAEGGVTTAASDAIRQFTIEAGALVNVTRWHPGSRLFPFVAAGGGYLRQLHQGNTLAQTGKVVYVGGGARIPLASRGAGGRLKQLGVRVDVRALVRSGGVSFDGRSHVAPALTAALFARF